MIAAQHSGAEFLHSRRRYAVYRLKCACTDSCAFDIVRNLLDVAIGVEDTASVQQIEPVAPSRMVADVGCFAPQNIVAKGDSGTLSEQKHGKL